MDRQEDLLAVVPDEVEGPIVHRSAGDVVLVKPDERLKAGARLVGPVVLVPATVSTRTLAPFSASPSDTGSVLKMSWPSRVKLGWGRTDTST